MPVCKWLHFFSPVRSTKAVKVLLGAEQNTTQKEDNVDIYATES